MLTGFSHFKKELSRLIEVENDIWIDLFDTVKTEIAQKKPNSDLLTSEPSWLVGRARAVQSSK